MLEQGNSRAVLVKRLKRIEGQIRGIQKMIEDERDCESVITQLAAARSAIEGVGALLLSNYMSVCFPQGENGDAINSLARCVSIWGRVHVGDGRR